MDRARCGAARSKSTDLVGALRRCITVGVTRASAGRPFRSLSPANVGVTEYLLSVRASTLEGGRRVHRARICTFVSRGGRSCGFVAVITGTTARCVRNVMLNCIAQFARTMRPTNRPDPIAYAASSQTDRQLFKLVAFLRLTVSGEREFSRDLSRIGNRINDEKTMLLHFLYFTVRIYNYKFLQN